VKEAHDALWASLDEYLGSELPFPISACAEQQVLNARPAPNALQARDVTPEQGATRVQDATRERDER
jgi:hypothetical protein